MTPSTFCCSIGRFGQDLDLVGIPESIVNSLRLWNTILEPCNDWPTGFRSRRVSTPLLENGSPQLGLAELLAYRCLQEGITPQLSPMGLSLGQRCLPTGLPISTSDEHVIDFLHHQPHGIITYGRKVDPAILGAQIVHAFPQTRIAFLTASKKRGRQFCDELARILGKPVKFADGNTVSDERDRRVVVTTYFGSTQVYPELEHRQVVIALNAEEAASERGQFVLSRCLIAKLFAFHRLGHQIPQRARGQLVRTVGLHSLVVPKHGRRVRPVVLIERKLRGVSPAAWRRHHRYRLSESIYKALITKNHVRTREIAHFARQITTRPQEWGISIPTTVSFGPSLRTVLVGANPDHAAHFAEQLPSWELYLTGPNASLRPAATAASQRNTSVLSLTAAGMITTPFGLAAIENKWIDILIWAVGDEYGPHLSPYRLAQPLTGERPLYLVDFFDDYHRMTRQRSRKRARNYVRNEWFPAGVDPHNHRMKAFLAHQDRLREQFDVA